MDTAELGHGSSRGSIYPLVALVLIAAVAVPAGGSHALPPALERVTTFADGSSSRTVDLAGCADADSQTMFKLAAGAEVDNASIRVQLAPGGAAAAAQVAVDIGSDGEVDAHATVAAGAPQVLALGPVGFNMYLGLRSWMNGTVPATVTACAPEGPVSVVLDGVDILQWSYGFVHTPPTLTAQPPDIELVSGSSVVGAIDLADYFSDSGGGSLRYGVRTDWGAAGEAAQLRVRVEGSLVDVESGNASFYGQYGSDFVEFAPTYYAADAYGLVAKPQHYPLIHLIPWSPPVATNFTWAGDSGTAGEGRRFLQQLHLPSDAVVTAASMDLVSPYDTATLWSWATTITVSCRDLQLAQVTPDGVPGHVVLDTSVLNRHLTTSAWYGIGFLEVEVAVDSQEGAPTVEVTNLSVSYTRYPAVPLPAIRGVTVDGTDTEVLAGVPFNLTVHLEPMNAAYRVKWYVDGELAAEGTTAYGLVLAEGDHTVTVRVFNESDETAFSVDFDARDRSGGPGGVPLWGVGALGATLAAVLVAQWWRRHPHRGT